MPVRTRLTAKERKAYRSWAEKELVGLFLEAMEDWKNEAGAGKVPVPGDWVAPIPCNPRLSDSDICITPYPGPWPPKKGAKEIVERVPKSRWPKIALQFKIVP